MARNKNVVKGRTKANKMIDLTKNKTSTPVTRYVGTIKTDMVRIMKHSNIPVLMEMAKDSEVLQNYFLNRRLNSTLLGENITLMDRALRTAISNTIVNDLKDAMKNKNSCYPGIWNDHNLFSLVYSLVNITMMADAPEKGHFLTVCSPNNIPTDAEKINGLPSSICIPFTEYNPNRLFQLCIVLQNTALNMIVETASRDVPSALMNAATDSVTIRMAEEFGRVLVSVMDEKGWLADDMELSGEISDQATAFIEVIEQPLIGYLMGLLSTSGLSNAVINEMFRHSTANAFYEIADEDFTTQFITSGNMIRYALSHKTEEESLKFGIGFICDVHDLYTVAKWTKDGGTIMDKKILNQLGSALKAFFDDAVRYCINIHLIHDDAVPNTSLNNNEDVPENDIEVSEDSVESTNEESNEMVEQE